MPVQHSGAHSAEDFYTVRKVASLTGYAIKTLYNQHATGTAPLGTLFTKVGGKLVMSRADYELWRNQQRKLSDAA